MQKSIAVVLCCLFVCVPESSFSQSFDSMLRSIERNNLALKAQRASTESEYHLMKSMTSLPAPEIEGYYLSNGEHTSGAYTELEIRQTFELSTIFGFQQASNTSQLDVLHMRGATLRQSLLVQASELYMRLVYLRKAIDLASSRVDQASKVYEHTKRQFELGAQDRLQVTRAEISVERLKGHLQDLYRQLEEAQASLTALNGGIEIVIDEQSAYPDFDIPELDSLIQFNIQTSPQVSVVEAQVRAAEGQISLASAQNLPSVSLGYAYQGVDGETYHGVLAGLAIPLWSGSNNVEGKILLREQHQTELAIAKQQVQLESTLNYGQCQALRKRVEALQGALSDANSTELLLKSYMAGHISFREYALELDFFHESMNELLLLELQLHNCQLHVMRNTL